MKSKKQSQEDTQLPTPVKAKIVSFVRYGDEVLGITQLGTGIHHNFKTKYTQTY